MAIENQDQFTSTQQAQTAEQPKAQAAQPATGSDPMLLNPLSAMWLMNIATANNGDAYLKAATKLVSELVENKDAEFARTMSMFDKTWKPTQIAIDVVDCNDPATMNNGTRRAFSAVVLSLKTQKHNGQPVVIYNTMLLEATGEELGQRKYPINDHTTGHRIEIATDQVTSDALENDMNNVVTGLIEKRYPGISSRVLMGVVVPREARVLNNEKVEGDSVFRSVMASVYNAIRAEEVMVRGVPDVNLAALAGSYQIHADVSVGARKVFDELGRPVRSDMRVEVYMTTRQNSNNLAVGAETVGRQQLVTVHMYLDLAYVRNDQESFAYQQQGIQRRPFDPTVVITHLEMANRVTPSNVVLGVVASTLVTNRHQYLAPLFTEEALASGLTGVNLRDIGALNIEGNWQGAPGSLGPKVDTSPTKMSLDERRTFLGSMVNYDNLHFAIDVPVGHPNSAVMQILMSMCKFGEDRVHFAAMADNLLNNGFSLEMLKANNLPYNYDLTQPNQLAAVESELHKLNFASNTLNWMLAGTWVAPGGEVRDVRDLDYLAAANYFHQNPDKLRAFAESFVPTLDESLRLQTRNNLMRLMTNESVKFTHRVLRINLDGSLIVALNQALHNLKVVQVAGGSAFVNQARQVDTGFASAGINPNRLSASTAPQIHNGGGAIRRFRG